MILQQIRIPQKIVLPFLKIIPIQTKPVQFKPTISAQGTQTFFLCELCGLCVFRNLPGHRHWRAYSQQRVTGRCPAAQIIYRAPCTACFHKSQKGHSIEGASKLRDIDHITYMPQRCVQSERMLYGFTKYLARLWFPMNQRNMRPGLKLSEPMQ